MGPDTDGTGGTFGTGGTLGPGGTFGPEFVDYEK